MGLHGWGANAQNLASVVPLLNLPDYQLMFPYAPFPHTYMPMGKMWYDLGREKGQGLQESRKLLTNWLLSLENSTGVPLSRTVLSGFSQGGAMTLDVGLTLPLAGLICMSGYLHPGAGTSAQSSFPPVLITHGRQDTVVPLQAAIRAKETLKTLGVAVEYHEFDMGHEIRPEVLEILRNFLVNV